ncbi:hypothetical protein B9Z19DRAFT_1066354 [Tuber borchii]|uniref:Secreted protein n=1 Tax=Tuber borchii TaxID=42251 RepID=A0A2T6ZMT9_TUBBO|nr:hypothetical protein B9Z19DRAFT_1066354 [Tuber borchii]
MPSTTSPRLLLLLHFLNLWRRYTHTHPRTASTPQTTHPPRTAARRTKSSGTTHKLLHHLENRVLLTAPPSASLTAKHVFLHHQPSRAEIRLITANSEKRTLVSLCIGERTAPRW